jgi:Tfp pilus assembly ATPase PilU
MVLLDQSIRDLVQSGQVTREEALRHVDDPKILGSA